MDANLLKLYVALQPKFREVMGAWRLWDWLYNFDGGFQAPIVDPEEVKEMNELESEFPFKIDGILRIPRTIDDSSEEARRRSLWGMVDWGKWIIGNTMHEGTAYMMHELKDITIVGTPTEAILNALCYQEGLKV